jgi:hypothetical protein
VSDQHYTASSISRRHRPNRRVAPGDGERTVSTLTDEFLGVGLAFGSALLFVGYEVEGLVEVTVYPRYRFSSDDRVQGHLGYVRVPLGTPWQEILEQVERVHARAEENYETAVSLRASEMRAHGAEYERAYDAITDLFRESWHGFALRLGRQGRIARDGVVFTGSPPGPVLAEWRGKPYTVQVFSSGSILVVTGDKRDTLRHG